MAQFIFPPLSASLDSEQVSGGSLPSKQMIVGGYHAGGSKVYPLAVDADGQLQIDVVSAMPLPTGAATSALQTAGNNILTTIDSDTSSLAGAISGTEMQVDVVASLPTGSNQIGKLAANSGVDIGDVDVLSSALPTGAATSALQTSSEALLTTIDADTSTLAGAVSGTEMQVDVITSALPSGAATSALQTSSEAILTTIDADTSSLAGCVTGTELQVDVVTIPDVTIDTYTVVDQIDSTITGVTNNVYVLSGTQTIPASTGTAMTLVAASAAAIKKIQTVEDIGEFMGIWYGSSTSTAGTATFGCVLPLGGGEVPLEIPINNKIYLKTLTSGTALVSGNIGINFLG